MENETNTILKQILSGMGDLGGLLLVLIIVSMVSCNGIYELKADMQKTEQTK